MADVASRPPTVDHEAAAVERRLVVSSSSASPGFSSSTGSMLSTPLTPSFERSAGRAARSLSQIAALTGGAPGSLPPLQLRRGPAPGKLPPPLLKAEELGVEHLRGCQILLPSGGSSNDPVRLKNAGQRLRLGALTPLMPRLLECGLLEPVYQPTNCSPAELMLPAATLQPPPSAGGLHPARPDGDVLDVHTSLPPWLDQGRRTPRTLRGLVRKKSQVTVGAPCPVQVLPPAASASAPVLKRPPLLARKRVSWQDESGPGSPSLMPTRDAGDLAEAGKRRSVQLMDFLYDLRRLGTSAGASSDSKPESASTATATSAVQRRGSTRRGSLTDGSTEGAGAGSSQEDAKVTSLMLSTLRETQDTCDGVRKLEETLRAGYDPLKSVGGTRHASAVVAVRTISVVTRKRELLEQLEEREATAEELIDDHDIFFAQVLAGDEPATGLLGIGKLVRELTHKPEASPDLADRSNFDVFAASFGLPKAHVALKRLRELASTLMHMWANSTVEEAQSGADVYAIVRLMDVVSGIGGDAKASEEVRIAMATCKQIVGDRLAEQVLAMAERLRDEDLATVNRSRVPQPASARKVHEAITDQIRNAVALGASTKHMLLQKAKMLGASYEAEERSRYALIALRFAEDLQHKDTEVAAAVEREEGVPRVGPAVDAAEAIERKIKEMIGKGAPPNHAHLQGARSVIKALHDVDATRRRLAARQERLLRATTLAAVQAATGQQAGIAPQSVDPTVSSPL